MGKLASPQPAGPASAGVASDWQHTETGHVPTMRLVEPTGPRGNLADTGSLERKFWQRRTRDIKTCQPDCEVTLDTESALGATASKHKQSPVLGSEAKSRQPASRDGPSCPPAREESHDLSSSGAAALTHPL